MADLNMIKPIGVQNLINKFCYTIGMLPTSYKESLTYEEQILAIGHYLETTVYPAINNNAEALTELQGLFVALEDYVNNYFENLDVQEEINNKLDDMVEQGTLQEIIIQYLQISGLLVYGTLAELKSAQNLVNGSTCKILGRTTYNDGEGQIYKIREITNQDIIDDFSLIALTNYPLLVGERIASNFEKNGMLIYTTLTELKTSKNFINGSTCKILGRTTYNDGEGQIYKIREKTNQDIIDDFNLIALTNYPLLVGERIINSIKKAIFFGDSWTGDINGNFSNNGNNWATMISESLGLIPECYAVGGWAIYSNGNHNLESEINNAISNIPIYERNNYEYAFILMGVNDWQGNHDPEDVKSALNTDFELLQTAFPTTKIVFIPMNTFNEPIDNLIRNLYSACISASLNKNIIQISNFYSFLNAYDNYLYKDESSTSPTHPFGHPNTEGHKQIAMLILGCLYGSDYPYNAPISTSLITNTPNITLNNPVISTNTKETKMYFEIKIPNGAQFEVGQLYNFAQMQYANHNYQFYNYNNLDNIWLPYGEDYYIESQAILRVQVTKDGKIGLGAMKNFTNSTGRTITLKVIGTFPRSF